MFYGRETELKKLNEMYDSNKFEFAVFYGRRRVGKTTLIKKFCKNKNAIYFVAREASGEINLQNFSSDVFSISNRDKLDNSYFSDWEKAFDYLHNISKDKRTILVIDEYPYLAENYRPISSIIQAHIDLNLKESKLFLILCGSSMSFMENQVLGYKSPLYGRRTSQFWIKPFTYFQALPFFNGFEGEEKGILYGITGGIPEYLSKINSMFTLKENIISLYLSPSGALYEEPTNLMKQELREPSTYNGIIEAIAGGASRLNEIATKNNMESNKCGKYLTSLISLGIVKKEIPITEKNSKKTIYLLDDQMFRFWYRFVFPNMSLIVSDLGEEVYTHKIEPQLNSFMGLVFEDICKQYLYKNVKSAPFFFGELGRWWGNNAKLRRQEEIDLMAFDMDSALFGECKWTNEPVDRDVLRDLLTQSEMFHYKNNYFYLFSKRGFTKKCTEEARKNSNVKLITYKEWDEI
ncbi:MAG: AAA family ATPase [Peptostreptococcaceae bacterium]|nr:AAA family ATPase [Peptostreptococcaceae bacterium]